MSDVPMLGDREQIMRVLRRAIDDDFIEVFRGEPDDPGYASVQALREHVADAVLAVLPSPADARDAAWNSGYALGVKHGAATTPRVERIEAVLDYAVNEIRSALTERRERLDKPEEQS
jgi:hypothetical protein